MGCNQSKKKDINQNKERTRAQPANQQGAYSPPTQAQNTPTRPGQGADPIGSQPRSYTEQRILEQDFYKDVVEQAALNFIDVTGQKDVDIQSRDYSDQVTSAGVATGSTFFQVPQASRGNTSGLVKSSGASASDVQFMTDTLAAISTAVQSMMVQDKGTLVVEFPDLDAQ
eukprot:TRINITY_DN3757_c0_g1_i1.p2 TRINITY_DN3757_c0_g1~~TRINITY_DN3757_c0_g1_i1.p2  ORF type:complete len:170 (-),score=40.57 TRINITY_DN3757_c0_g1_i1:1706-2215(-)